MAGGSLFEHAAVRRGWVDFQLGYQPAFNGLRGIGVTTIVLYHCLFAFEDANQSWYVLPGAWMWLELFFTQSGFLITSLLLDEWYRTGEIRLRNFYARRALRLLPALLVVVVFVIVALSTFSPYRGARGPWLEVWGALFHRQNWVGASGSTTFPFYLSHTWSLSIEEQFYAAVPIGLIVIMAWRRSLRRAIPLIAAGALASALWMGVLASRAAGPTDLARPYYGTDTRAQGLLVGVALAIAIHAGFWLRSDNGCHDRIARIWGIAGFAVLVVIAFTAKLGEQAWYHGGFLLCSMSVAGVLSELLRHPEGRLARAVSWRPFEATGKMAYGLYLWHWPLIMVVDQFTSWPTLPTVLLQVTAAFVVASLSYRYLERPILDRWGSRFPRTSPERIAAHRERLLALEAGESPVEQATTATVDLRDPAGRHRPDGDARPAPSATPLG